MNRLGGCLGIQRRRLRIRSQVHAQRNLAKTKRRASVACQGSGALVHEGGAMCDKAKTEPPTVHPLHRMIAQSQTASGSVSPFPSYQLGTTLLWVCYLFFHSVKKGKAAPNPLRKTVCGKVCGTPDKPFEARFCTAGEDEQRL